MGGFTDLGDIGAIFDETGEKMFPWCFHGVSIGLSTGVGAGSIAMMIYYYLCTGGSLRSYGASGQSSNDASAVERAPPASYSFFLSYSNFVSYFTIRREIHSTTLLGIEANKYFLECSPEAPNAI